MNAYDYVENLLKQGKTYITENNLRDYEDWQIALTILKTKYNAKYEPPYDFHFCGGYSFDNPYMSEKKRG